MMEPLLVAKSVPLPLNWTCVYRTRLRHVAIHGATRNRH